MKVINGGGYWYSLEKNRVIVKFPEIYSLGNISKLGINGNGNKFESLKCIKKPIWKNSNETPFVKNVLRVNFWSI